MSLHFFFFVTDQDSWADIGFSLSHFVIAEAVVIFLQVFFLLARLLLTFNADLEEVSGFDKKSDDLNEDTKSFVNKRLIDSSIPEIYMPISSGYQA